MLLGLLFCPVCLSGDLRSDSIAPCAAGASRFLLLGAGMRLEGVGSAWCGDRADSVAPAFSRGTASTST